MTKKQVRTELSKIEAKLDKLEKLVFKKPATAKTKKQKLKAKSPCPTRATLYSVLNT